MTSPFAIILTTGETAVDLPIAVKFASKYPIALICDPQQDLSEAVQLVEKNGGQAKVFATDVSNTSNLAETIGEVTQHFGNTCAVAIFAIKDNILSTQAFLKQTGGDVRKTLMNPIVGAFNFAQQTLPLLLKFTHQSEFAATLLFTGSPVKSVSSAISENALVALSRSLGREYGKKGVHVAHVKFNKTTPKAPAAGAIHPENETQQQKQQQLADTFWHLHTQPLSCFSNELTI